MALAHWQIQAHDPVYYTWVDYDTITGTLQLVDAALATQNHPFTGTSINEFLTWLNVWYHNAQIDAF